MTERTGLLGAVAGEIDRIQAAQRDLDALLETQIAQLSSDLDDGTRESLARTLRQRAASTESHLRMSLDTERQRQTDLRKERRDVLIQIAACREFLAANEARAAQYTRAIALIEEAIGLLDRTTDWENINELHRWRPRRLPDRMRYTQEQLRAAERRLAELGDE
jgi:hypothetical protein